MVFSKLSELVSGISTRFSGPKPGPKSSTSPYTPLGLPPLPVTNHGLTFDNSTQKSYLRLSSSLQDFSVYRPLDPELGENNPETSRTINNLRRENGVSSFSKDKTPPLISKKRKWTRVLLTILCLLLLAFIIYALSVLYINWSQGALKYYVVLDCGSTGTRIYVYQSSLNHNKEESLPILLKSFPEDFRRKDKSQSGRAYNRMETEPGFDKLVHNISGLRGAIKPLIKWAKKKIPKKAYKNTSLFLYATAGLRRIPNTDSEWLLNNAWSILKSSPFVCKREWVKIITGMEEAYFGWIALNYHTGTLGAIPSKKTLGALDLGGSSLQVTFESTSKIQDETSLELSIGPVKHRLTAYSLAGYGLNDAFDKSVVRLVKKLPNISKSDLINGKVKINHPCLQNGYNEEYLCSRCSSIGQESGSESPKNGVKLGKTGKPGVLIRLIGAPKWDECRALAKIAVNSSEWSDQAPGIDCELKPCALPENLPRPIGQFNAMSGFFVVYRFFNLTSEASMDDVLEKGREFCEKNWDIAKVSVAPQPFIEQYCFRAPYVTLLLREGLHITDTQVSIGSGSITWTLGVALLEAGKDVSSKMVFHGYNILKMKINPVILFGVLFVSLFVLLCAVFCVGKSAQKYFRRPYLPLFRHNNVSSTPVLNIPSPFRFQRWSPINSGDGRVKLPLSPTVTNTQRNPFESSGGVQLTESSLYRSSSSVGHSYSSDSLFENNNNASFWTTHGGSKMRLQSRRSQSREDLSSTLGDAHLVKL